MVFDLDKAEQGDWFSFFASRFDQNTGEIIYDPPEDGAAEFCIRSMNQYWEERRKSRKRESKMVLNPKSGAMERVVYFADQSPEQEIKEAEDAWDYAITGMRNALGPDGEAIECTRENKLKLVRIPMFLRFVKRVFQILDGEAAKEKDGQEKN
ncbi:MAG: hypothetical protein A4E65_03688 [Syntrophorhabdus sp. PtaU1.Bin153]|nr:MAG: hypothetical protein A4E65_03688 [Syntrophorhabdus sp. PtaU1.Bin153]